MFLLGFILFGNQSGAFGHIFHSNLIISKRQMFVRINEFFHESDAEEINKIHANYLDDCFTISFRTVLINTVWRKEYSLILGDQGSKKSIFK